MKPYQGPLSPGRMKKGSAASDARKSNFKFQGMTTDELRRRREETQVEIRKAKREDSLSKRRNVVEGSAIVNESNNNSNNNGNYQPPPPASTTKPTTSTSTTTLSPAFLADMSQGLYAPSTERQLQAITEVRKVLSKERNPPIQEVVECGVLPRVVEMLGALNLPPETDQTQAEAIILEAAWVLTNIASGASEHTAAVVNAGTVPLLLKLLLHPSEDIREQCIWALGNIAGDSATFRDYLLRCDILSPLLEMLAGELDAGINRVSIVRNGTWTISNLCRGKPAPSWNQVAPVLPILSRLLVVPDNEILGDAGWALSYLSDGPNEAIALVIGAGVVPRLVALLGHTLHTVQTPALRALGNIVTGDDGQTQTVIDAGALTAFSNLLRTTTRQSIMKEACWAISNVSAGTPDQIQAVIDANLIPQLVYLLGFGEYKTQKEACWAICNATSAHLTHPHQTRYLVSQGCIKPLVDILPTGDNRIVLVALDGLENILSVGEQDSLSSDVGAENRFAVYLEEANGLDILYNLQNHPNENVYLKAKGIIDKYFSADGDDILPEDLANPGMTFDFSTNGAAAPGTGGFNFAS